MDLIQILDMTEAIGLANNVHCFGHALRRWLCREECQPLRW